MGAKAMFARISADEITESPLHALKPHTGERRAYGLGVWQEARSEDPLLDLYFENRRLRRPERCDSVRFHPRARIFGVTMPAMVCLVTDIHDPDVAVGVHLTGITRDGQRAVIYGRKARQTFGPVKGGVIRLTADEDVAICLGIGEGVESALSLRRYPEFGPSTPIWSAISSSGIAKFPILSGIESLFIAVDHDKAGNEAAKACTKRWCKAGHEVTWIRANDGDADLNDLLRRRP